MKKEREQKFGNWADKKSPYVVAVLLIALLYMTVTVISCSSKPSIHDNSWNVIDVNDEMRVLFNDKSAMTQGCFVFLSNKGSKRFDISISRNISQYSDYLTSEYKAKIAKGRVSTLPDYKETLKLFNSCLDFSSRMYCLDSLNSIYCSTMDFPDIAVELTREIGFDSSGFNKKSFLKNLQSTSLRTDLNNILNLHNIKVKEITIDPEGLCFFCDKGKFLDSYTLDNSAHIPDSVLFVSLIIKASTTK